MHSAYIYLAQADQAQDRPISVGYRNKEQTLNSYNQARSQYQCSFILQGTVNLQSGEIFYPLNVNSAYQHFPDTDFPSYQYVSEDYLEYHFCLDASVYESMKRFQVLYTASEYFEIQPDPVYLHWMKEHVASPMTKSTEDVFEFYLNTQKLLHFLHKSSIQHTNSTELGRLQDVLPMLSANYKDPLNLEKIAYSLGYTYETFRKKFKTLTGMSPLQFHMTCRFQYARRLLTEGHSITETAELTGYTDNFTFSKQFKKYNGENPKDCRPK